VPLTNSLYARGKLSNASRVLVDVGTGFYVEKDTKSAVLFYENKSNELGANIKDLETIIQSKTNNVRVIEEGKLTFLEDKASCLMFRCIKRFSASSPEAEDGYRPAANVAACMRQQPDRRLFGKP
jgi:hypothetical protein